MQPIHERMFAITPEELLAARTAGADEAAIEEAQSTDTTSEEGSENQFEGAPGWVIEIRGHHFHNSQEQIKKFNSGKSYLFNSFLFH